MIKMNAHSRGSAFVTTMWVIIALSAIVLVLSRSMRVEAIASANRLSSAQAEAAERGAEQFLCSVVDAEIATPGSTQNVSMEARQIGDGYFWVMKPDPDDETVAQYGLTDEAGKIDLNTAPETVLSLLPNMPSDVAASIVNWRQVNPTTDGLGATDADYESMNPSYSAKHAVFESTEEVMLIKNMTTDLLFGFDKNRNGVVEPNEMQAGGVTATVSAGVSTSNRGIYPFITVYGVKATTSTITANPGTTLVSVNAPVAAGGIGGGRGGAGRGGAATPNTAQLRSVLQAAGVSNVAGAIAAGAAAQQRIPGGFTSTIQWAAYANLTSADFQKVYSQLTAKAAAGGAATTTTAKALINVNTAPLQVLMCLPGIQQSDAEAITSHRQTTTPTDPRDISWLLDAMPHTDLQQAAGYLTGFSMVYSGDIVAVSPDGRSFRRIRVVIDGSKTPAYVMYRRDLTGWGWPLPANIRTAMRAGQAPPDVGATATSSNSLLGKGM